MPYHKNLSLDVPSTQLNELVFMRNLDLPQNLLGIQPSSNPKKKNQNQMLESNHLIVKLHGLFYAWQATSYLH